MTILSRKRRGSPDDLFGDCVFRIDNQKKKESLGNYQAGPEEMQ